MINIELAYSHPESIKKLFDEYTRMLVENDESFAEYLKVQNYDSELDDLQGKYGLPDGRLYIVKVEDSIAGCIGLKKIDDERCEMKRLYVRPEFRGKHLANILVQKIIDDAKEIGYKSMLLDTLPFLEEAIHIYSKFGFCETACYNDSPVETSIFMELKLSE